MCNVVFAHQTAGLDEGQRREYLHELRMPLDPWEQADLVFGEMG